MTVEVLVRGATLSDDDAYRYLLWRSWRDGPTLLAVCLNPSTADGIADDPTVRRLVGFAARDGFGTLLLANAFALRSTDPGALLRAADPVGPGDDGAILDALGRCDAVAAAWGACDLRLVRRTERVARLLRLRPDREVLCWGETLRGAPRHPLYLRSDAPLAPWNGSS